MPLNPSLTSPGASRLVGPDGQPITTEPDGRAYSITGTDYGYGLGYSAHEEFNNDLQPRLWRGYATDHGVADRMVRTDPLVAGMIRAITLLLTSAEWEITSASDDPEDQEVAEFIEWALFERPRQSWRQVVDSQTRKHQFGFALFEQVLAPETDPRSPHRGKVVLDNLRPMMPWSVEEWVVTPDEHLVGVRQVAYTGQPMPGAVPISRVVRITHNQQGHNWEGLADLRSAYRGWKIRDHGWRYWAIASERGAVGVPTLTLPRDATPAVKTAAEKALRDLRSHQKGYALLYEGMDLQAFHASTASGGPDMQELIRAAAYEMVVSMSAMFLMTGQETGTFSLGESQQSFFALAGQASANHFAEVLNHGTDGVPGLIERLVRLNYGDAREAPRLQCGGIRDKDVAAVLNALPALVQAGILTVDENLQRHIRGRLDLPDVVVDEEEDEPTEGAGVAPEGMAGTPPGGKPADRGFNGIQIRSAREIVASVAAGELDRETGIAQIEIALGIPRELAEKFMGTAGTGEQPQQAAPEEPEEPEEPPQEDAEEDTDDEPSEDGDDGEELSRHHQHAHLTAEPAGPVIAGRQLMRYPAGVELYVDLERMIRGQDDVIDRLGTVLRRQELELLERYVDRLVPAIEERDYRAIQRLRVPGAAAARRAVEPLLQQAFERGYAGVAAEMIRQLRGEQPAGQPQPVDDLRPTDEGALSRQRFAEDDLPGDGSGEPQDGQGSTPEEQAQQVLPGIEVGPTGVVGAIYADLPDMGQDEILRAETGAIIDWMLGRMTRRAQQIATSQAQSGIVDAASITDALREQSEAALRARGGEGAVLGYSSGRGSAIDRAADEGRVRSVVYSAILDSATCTPCTGVDRRFGPSTEGFDVEAREYAAYRPPYVLCEGGNRCRCMLVATYADEGSAVGEPLSADAERLEVKDGTMYRLPKAARNNARKVLEWREEHGDEVKGMTSTGWRRARQLAENAEVSGETVKAMSAFNRHRGNYEKARAELRDTGADPWTEPAIVAWLGWGGTTGVDWARRLTGAADE